MQAFLKSGKVGGASGSTSTAGNSEDSAESTVHKKKGPPAPWVEKYRPRSVDEVVEQGEVMKVLRECLAGGDLPHLLFYGPPGTGKTSSILAAARQLFGSLTKERVLELNASDERGIQVIREKVKAFSQLTAASSGPDGRPCPPFKLVILDEADSMTKDAQAALRRTMEKETRSTRFCLVCNYVSKIIPPLTSRCSKFRFKSLSKEMVIERLRFICKAEKLEFEERALELLVDNCNGDLRRAITSLQSCGRLAGSVTETSILEVIGFVPKESVEEFLFMEDYGKLEKFIDKFTMDAHSTSQLFEQLNATIVSANLTDKRKAMISEKLAICEYRLLEGGSEMMQLMDLGCTIILAHKS